MNDNTTLEQEILQLAQGLDKEKLHSFIEHINALNSVLEGDKRCFPNYRNAAIAALEIQKKDSVEADMPLLINGREHATCLETLQWLDQHKGVEKELFSPTVANARSMAEHSHKAGDANESEGRSVMIDTILTLDELSGSVGVELEKMAALASQVKTKPLIRAAARAR